MDHSLFVNATRRKTADKTGITPHRGAPPPISEYPETKLLIIQAISALHSRLAPRVWRRRYSAD